MHGIPIDALQALADFRKAFIPRLGWLLYDVKCSSRFLPFVPVVWSLQCVQVVSGGEDGSVKIWAMIGDALKLAQAVQTSHSAIGTHKPVLHASHQRLKAHR